MKHLLLLIFFFSTKQILVQDKQQKFDNLFNKLYDEGKFNGNILIADKGNIVYKKSFGLANETIKQALNENSIFELASCSKQFTAMAIAILNKQNKLDYDDNIEKLIPELAFYKNVTIRHLLNHTSGLPDYMDLFESVWDKSKIANNNDLIALYKKHQPKLTFKPNSAYEYSNTGYALLATIIERASKMSYDDFLSTTIFVPLKMTNTFVYTRRYKPLNIKNYAFGYVLNNKNKKVLPDKLDDYSEVYYLDGIKGDGTVNSTTNDLLLWDRALYGTKLLDKNEMQKLFTPATLNNKELTEYGFGWEIEYNDKHGKIVSHDGAWPGYVTYIERDLDNDKTIIILQNTEEGELPAKAIRNILYSKSF